MMVLMPLMAVALAVRSAAEKLPPRVEAMKLMQCSVSFKNKKIDIWYNF
jgi:hypothetical protein